MKTRTLLACLVALSSCTPLTTLVQRRAAIDFECAETEVALEPKGSLYLARGCGRLQAYGVTGEWGVRWAVPCPTGERIDAGYSGFDYAPHDLCAEVWRDAGVQPN